MSRQYEVRREARQRCWGLPVPSHLKHGKGTRACDVYGCDCKACLPSGRRTWKNSESGERAMTRAERQRKSRKKLRGQPVPEGTKHGVYTYRTYGCPCAACKAANRQDRHKRRNAWMYTATGHWSVGGGKDRIWWPRPGDSIEDCPFEQCFHADHKETRLP